MTTGHSKDYCFSNKNVWRKQIYKNIKFRTKNSPIRVKDMTVVYLAGPDDLDRKYLKQKGFMEENLYIVERDKNIVTKHRAKGKNVIHGDLIEVLLAFAYTSSPIHVLIADLCSGLNKDVGDLLRIIMRTNMIHVCVVNMLRGRDPISNELRKNIQNKTKVDLKKHRGEFLFLYYLCLINTDFITPLAQYRIENEKFKIPKQLAFKKIIRLTQESLVKKMNPLKASYKSGNTFMDSVVFNYCSVPIVDDDKQCLKVPETLLNLKIKPIIRQLAAVKATATRRKYNRVN